MPIQKVAPKFGHVKAVLAVMSGKGGVGKSTVCSLLAASMARAGMAVGILDADVTGPSIPRMFGMGSGLGTTPDGAIRPAISGYGVKVISLNLLLPQEDIPVVWRGPVINATIKQFWEEVSWGELDCLLVDLPPGTGDAPLTVIQLLPLDGLVIVSSPQDLALMVVRKAINMARQYQIPIWGLIENMSYTQCPKCGEHIHLFGPSQAARMAEEQAISLSTVLPLELQLSQLCDTGRVEEYRSQILEDFSASIRDRLQTVRHLDPVLV